MSEMNVGPKGPTKLLKFIFIALIVGAAGIYGWKNCTPPKPSVETSVPKIDR